MMPSEPPRLTVMRKEDPETDAYLRSLENAAYKDPLTGLLRPKPFRQGLIETLYRIGKNGKPFHVVRLDLDRFKEYNDTYGHEAGDELLRRFATALQKSSRATDISVEGRLGGDEFAAIFLGAEEESVAYNLVTRLYSGINNGEIEKVGISAGVYKVLPMLHPFLHRNGWDDNRIASYILDKADRAVYASKAVKDGHPLTISSYGSQELPVLIPLPQERSLRRAA